MSLLTSPAYEFHFGGRPYRVVIAGRYVAAISDEYVYAEVSMAKLLEARFIDLAGDGREAIVLRYEELLDDGWRREVLAAFRLRPEGLRRVFASELGHARGKQRLATRWRFVKRGRASDLLVEALPAVEIDATSQRASTEPELQPLPLPWDPRPRVLYRFAGEGFSRVE